MSDLPGWGPGRGYGGGLGLKHPTCLQGHRLALRIIDEKLLGNPSTLSHQLVLNSW